MTWWAIEKRYSAKSLDGASRRFHGAARVGQPYYLFETREAAREFIRKEYGYIAQRPDLRAHPHGWLMPRPVRVKVRLERA